MFYQVVGYAPDDDPTKPGILTDCENLLPSLKGMEPGASAQTAGFFALGAQTAAGTSSACRGAAVLTKLDGTLRFFAGSATDLWEGSGGVWTSRTRASGGSYGLTDEYRWTFAQFGNVSLAASKEEVIQRSTSGAFADISASPAIKANIIETARNFVLAFDTNETTYGDSPDRWWCSALGDEEDWTPAPTTTQATTGRLTDSPGRITAARRFGDGVVAFKRVGMWFGSYSGPPDVWSWTYIPGEAGALCNEAVVDIGTPENPVLIFMGDGDFYLFDGARPRPIGQAIKETVFGELLRKRQGTILTLHDKTESRVYFWYPTVDSVNPDKCVVYHYRAGRWGRSDRQVQAAVNYVASGVTYDNMTSYGTYDSLPATSYDNTFVSADATQLGVFETGNNLVLLTGTPGASSLTTGDYGGDDLYTMVDRVRMRFLRKPSNGTMTNYYRHNLGDALTAGSSSSMNGSKFDLQREARWHRFVQQYNGDYEVTGININAIPSGDE